MSGHLRLAADRAYTLEFCVCGQHLRIMAVAALVAVWRARVKR